MENELVRKKPISGVNKNITRLLARSEAGIFLATVFVIIIISLRDHTFLSTFNIISILNYISYTGIIAVPLVFLLVSRLFDMSIGSATGLFSMLIAASTKIIGIPVIPAIILVIICALILGFLNGRLVVTWNISAFIVTLATMFVCRGLMQAIGQGRSIGSLPESLVALGNNTILGLPVNVYVFLIIALIGWFVLEFTVFGKTIYTIGNNEEIAKTAGINVESIKKMLFFFTAVACVISAFFMTVNFRSAVIGTGMGWEFQVTAGCMLGGCSMYGGKGTVFGGLLGVTFMAVLSYGFQSLGIASALQIILTGLVLIISVFIDTVRMNKLTT